MQTIHANTAPFVSTFSSLWVRLVGVIPMAFIATLGLLYAMYSMVAFDYQEVEPAPKIIIPSVVMPKIVTIANIFDDLPVRPEERIPPPKIVAIIEPVGERVDGGLKLDPSNVVIDDGGFDPFATSAQIMPFIKVAPIYPAVAANKGIEGYVDVLFDVSEIGSTENIRILAFVPSSIFNKSVIKAVKAWKYKPMQVEGVAIKTRDVKERIRFNMQK